MDSFTPTIRPELLEELLKSTKKPEDIFGPKPRRRLEGVDGAVAKRQLAGPSPYRRRQISWPLRGHDVAGLDGHYVAIVGFVRPGTRAHVDHRARIAEGREDSRAEAGVFAAEAGVFPADGVIPAVVHRSSTPRT